MTRSLTAFTTVLALMLVTACGSSRTGPSDRTIESNVRTAIASAVPSSAISIEVQVDKGVVTLTGRAPSEEDRRKIGDAAGDVKGVKTVINNIQLE